MRRLLAVTIPVAALWLLPATAAANDSHVGASGGSVYPVRATDIRLDSETVQAVCFGSFAEYRIDFRFVNEGKRRKVKLGFPFAATVEGENTDRPVGFQAWQNGRPLTVRAATARNAPKGSGNGYFVHTAVFPHGATRITVSYLAQPSGIAGTGSFYQYWLHTGSTWKGTIGTAVVRYRFADSFRPQDVGLAPYDPGRRVSLTAPPGWTRPLPLTYQWRFSDFEPKLDRAYPRQNWWKPSSAYDIVLGCAGTIGGRLTGGKWTWSSVAAPEFGEKGMDNVQDGDLMTCWAEGVNGLGAGEWVEKRFKRPVRLRELRILPGNNAYDSAFGKFARPRIMRAVFSDGSSRTLQFRDAPTLQRFPVNVKTRSVRLVVESAYEGSDYPATCVSEVEFGTRQAPGYAPFLKLIRDPQATGRLAAWAGPRAPEPSHSRVDWLESWDDTTYAGGDLLGISDQASFPADVAPFKEPSSLDAVTAKSSDLRLPDAGLVGEPEAVNALSAWTYEIRYSSGIDLLVNTRLVGAPRATVLTTLVDQAKWLDYGDKRKLPFDIVTIAGQVVGAAAPGRLSLCSDSFDCSGSSSIPSQVFWREGDRSFHLYARSDTVTMGRLLTVARAMIELQPAAHTSDVESSREPWPWWKALGVAAALMTVMLAVILWPRRKAESALPPEGVNE